MKHLKWTFWFVAGLLSQVSGIVWKWFWDTAIPFVMKHAGKLLKLAISKLSTFFGWIIALAIKHLMKLMTGGYGLSAALIFDGILVLLMAVLVLMPQGNKDAAFVGMIGALSGIAGFLLIPAKKIHGGVGGK